MSDTTGTPGLTITRPAAAEKADDERAMNIRACRVCRGRLVRDDSGQEVHFDTRRGTACMQVRGERTENETLVAALRSIEETGSLRAFRRPRLVPSISDHGA